MSSTEKEEPGGSSFGEGFSLEQDGEDLGEGQPAEEGKQIGREGVKGGMAAHGRVLAVGAGQQVGIGGSLNAGDGQLQQDVPEDDGPAAGFPGAQYSREAFSRHWVTRLATPINKSWLPLRYFQPHASASSMTRVMPNRPKKPTIC